MSSGGRILPPYKSSPNCPRLRIQIHNRRPPAVVFILMAQIRHHPLPPAQARAAADPYHLGVAHLLRMIKAHMRMTWWFYVTRHTGEMKHILLKVHRCTHARMTRVDVVSGKRRAGAGRRSNGVKNKTVFYAGSERLTMLRKPRGSDILLVRIRT